MTHGDRMAGLDSRLILLTVEVEDYFQVGRFDRHIRRERWPRFEMRIERNTRKTLDLLGEFGIRATFFVLGWVADTLPELVREIAGRGHEVASLGYDYRTIAKKHLGPVEFREDIVRARAALERASGRRVVGNRVPHYLGPADLWALDVLAREGYAYDSSVKPIFRRFADEQWRWTAHQHPVGGTSIWELPLSAWHLAGLSVPVAGAGYFRHLPHPIVKRAVRRWHDKYRAPFVMYFRVWELDPEQPRIESISRLAKLRHYRNLDQMERILRDYLNEYRVSGIAEYLGVQREPAPILAAASSRGVEAAPSTKVAAGGGPDDRADRGDSHSSGRSRRPITIVVPCYNERASLPYLANTLRSLTAEFQADYELSFVFVDDGSSDETWTELARLFGSDPRCALLQHETNRGVAAAILTGIRAAKTETVCSIDCDCTYDPHQLRHMVPLLDGDVALVTASPYHPSGLVLNVPSWRLSLSRAASFLYRRVLRHKLFTYTSCFRVYRKSAVADVELERGGFLGVAEMIGKLDLRGARIVECPAVLEVRIFGQSKMRIIRAIGGHLRLLGRLALLRVLTARRQARPVASGMVEASPSALVPAAMSAESRGKENS